jgi:hypothetical protein
VCGAIGITEISKNLAAFAVITDVKKKRQRSSVLAFGRHYK